MNKKIKNKKVYNVWLVLEEIEEESQDEGKDIEVRKIAKFKKEGKAKVQILVGDNNPIILINNGDRYIIAPIVEQGD